MDDRLRQLERAAGSGDLEARRRLEQLLRSVPERTWTVDPPRTSASLTDLWVASRGDVYVAAGNGVWHKPPQGEWSYLDTIQADSVDGFDDSPVFNAAGWVTRRTHAGHWRGSDSRLHGAKRVVCLHRKAVYVVGGGVAVSSNGGYTWRPLSGAPPLDRLWATSAGDLFGSTPAGLWRGTSTAQSWHQVAIPGAGDPLLCAVGDAWLLVRGRDVHRSVDLRRWSLVHQSPRSLTAVASHADAEVVVGGEAGYLVRSLDAGLTWHAELLLTPNDVTAVAAAEGGRWYAVGTCGLLASIDPETSHAPTPCPAEHLQWSPSAPAPLPSPPTTDAAQRTPEGPHTKITAWCWADARRAAIGDLRGRVCLWDPDGSTRTLLEASGDPVCALVAGRGRVWALRGSELIGLGLDGEPTRTLRRDVQGFWGPPEFALLDDVLVAHDGQQAAHWQWQRGTWAPLAEPDGAEHGARCTDTSSDGERLWVGPQRVEIRSRAGDLLGTVPRAKVEWAGFTSQPDRLLLSTTHSSYLYDVSRSTGKGTKRLPLPGKHSFRARQFRVAPDRRYLTCAGATGTHVLDLERWEVHERLDTPAHTSDLGVRVSTARLGQASSEALECRDLADGSNPADVRAFRGRTLSSPSEDVLTDVTHVTQAGSSLWLVARGRAHRLDLRSSTLQILGSLPDRERARISVAEGVLVDHGPAQSIGYDLSDGAVRWTLSFALGPLHLRKGQLYGMTRDPNPFEDRSGELFRLDPRTGSLRPATLSLPDGSLTLVAATQRGLLLAHTSTHARMVLCDPDTGEVLAEDGAWSYAQFHSPDMLLALSTCQRHLLWIPQPMFFRAVSTSVSVLDLSGPQLTTAPPLTFQARQGLRALAAASDLTRAIAAGEDLEILGADGAPLARQPLHGAEIRDVFLSPDARWAYTWCSEGRLRRWAVPQ